MTHERNDLPSLSRISLEMWSTLDFIVQRVLDHQRTLKFTRSLKVREQMLKYDMAESNYLRGRHLELIQRRSRCFSWLARKRLCLLANSIFKQSALLTEKGHGPTNG